MENFRSKSTREGRMKMESYYAPTTMKDLRSSSTSRAHSASSSPSPPPYKELKLNNSKSRVSSGFASKNWSLNEPELQRKKRVAGYKAYSVEGKMKGSFRRSFRWIKDTCSHVVYGWW